MQLPTTVPPLAEFLRWIAETPAAFQDEPEGVPQGKVNVRAVVGDLLETLFGRFPEPNFLECFEVRTAQAAERNRLRWVLAACHLLWHPSLRGGALRRISDAEGRLRRFFIQELPALAAVAPADRLIADEERREELIRRALRAFDLALPGESDAEARDRLAQVDSVERHKLLAAVAKRQEKLRREEELRRKAAEEAASKANRE
jgi:hypothetical protein